MTVENVYGILDFVESSYACPGYQNMTKYFFCIFHERLCKMVLVVNTNFSPSSCMYTYLLVSQKTLGAIQFGIAHSQDGNKLYPQVSTILKSLVFFSFR